MMKMRFQKANEMDLKLILSFFKIASQTLERKKVSQWSYWQDPPRDKIKWVEEGLNKNEFYFVYNESGHKIGMFRLLTEDVLYWDQKGKEKDVRYIHSLVVLPEYAGHGIGINIMQKIIDKLKAKGVGKLRLDCDASNKHLCQYYTSLGFLKVGSKETPYSINNLYESCIS
ncbi:GNAT family N-acetyltransferase [Lutimonas zeaxanthinifaciens]|uniref:GNAT family N-acetyltransferase n=1 Tax=Lutimonas zeaxanthinifaciens TaxID=3060215 RepID=UPI00265D1E4D|nr:GNAT family N-acetyltransferase [Lutimonas sp. YSD2104]WKK66052.1 GNAT family N-acetyltransferase [Lutimonas sp. YSD2104]